MKKITTLLNKRIFMKIKKIIITVVLFCFLSEQFIWAAGGAENLNAPAKISVDNFSLQDKFSDDKSLIPASAKVETKYFSNAKETIINIQDSHASLSAQYSIVDILKNLLSAYDINVVAVEGGSGYIDTSILGTFPDAKVREKTAAYLMKEGKISAGEFFSVLSNDKNIALYGAEDKGFYEENAEYFKKIYSAGYSKINILKNIIQALEEKEKKTYSPDLAKIVFKSRLHRAGKINFAVYWEDLKAMSSKYGIDTEIYLNIKKFIEALSFEKNINFDSACLERNVLIDEIMRRSSKNELEKLLSDSTLFKEGKLSESAYYRRLWNLGRDKNIDITFYSNFSAYLDYMESCLEFDMSLLTEEIERAETVLFDKLFLGINDRKLYELCRITSRLISFFKIELSTEDVNYIARRIGKISANDYFEFLDNENAVNISMEKIGETIAFVRENMKFYELAEKRNGVMLNNTIKAMRNEGKSAAILISGGHHSKGLSNLVKESGLSCLVFSPKVSKDIERPYAVILTRKTGAYSEAGRKAAYETIALETYFNTGDISEIQEVLAYSIGQSYLSGDDVKKEIAKWVESYTKFYENMPANRREAMEYPPITPETLANYLHSITIEPSGDEEAFVTIKNDTYRVKSSGDIASDICGKPGLKNVSFFSIKRYVEILRSLLEIFDDPLVLNNIKKFFINKHASFIAALLCATVESSSRFIYYFKRIELNILAFKSERGPRTKIAVAKFNPKEITVFPSFQKDIEKSWGMMRDRAPMYFKYQLEGGETQEVNDGAPDEKCARKEVWTIDKHIEEFKKNHPDYEVVGFVGNGNILANASLAGWVNGKLYAIEQEKAIINSGNSRVYPSLVMWKDGHYSIEEIKFTPENKVLKARNDEDITLKINFTNSGIGILKNSSPYDLAEYYYHDGDVRHYLDFPFIPSKLIHFGVSHFYDNEGNAKKELLIPAINGERVTLKLEERGTRLEEGDINELEKNLIEEKRYKKAESKENVKYGFYFIDRKIGEITIGLWRGINPHNISGIDKNGNLVSIIVAGKSNRIGITFKEAQDKLKELGITDAIIFDNGADAMMNMNGKRIIPSFTGRNRILSLLIFARPRVDGKKNNIVVTDKMISDVKNSFFMERMKGVTGILPVIMEEDEKYSRFAHINRVLETSKMLADYISKKTGRVFDIKKLELMALCYDIGRIPFGKVGEKALKEFGFPYCESGGILAALEASGINLPDDIQNELLGFHRKGYKFQFDETNVLMLADKLTNMISDIIFAMRLKILVINEIPVTVREAFALDTFLKNITSEESVSFDQCVLGIIGNFIKKHIDENRIGIVRGVLPENEKYINKFVRPYIWRRINHIFLKGRNIKEIISKILDTLEEKHAKYSYDKEFMSKEEFILNQLVMFTDRDALRLSSVPREIFEVDESEILEGQNAYVEHHTKRVVKIALRIARKLGLPEDLKRILKYAILAHDLGRTPIFLYKEEMEKIQRGISAVPLEERTEPVISYLDKWLEKIAPKYDKTGEIKKINNMDNNVEKHKEIWRFYIAHAALGKKELTEREKIVADNIFSHASESLKVLVERNILFPVDIFYLIGMHHDYEKFNVQLNKYEEWGKDSDTLSIFNAMDYFYKRDIYTSYMALEEWNVKMRLLMSIFVVADSFEQGNNYERLVVLRGKTRVESFDETINHWLKKRFDEMENIEEKSPIAALIELIKEEDEELFAIVSEARTSSRLMPGDILMMRGGDLPMERLVFETDSKLLSIMDRVLDLANKNSVESIIPVSRYGKPVETFSIQGVSSAILNEKGDIIAMTGRKIYPALKFAGEVLSKIYGKSRKEMIKEVLLGIIKKFNEPLLGVLEHPAINVIKQARDKRIVFTDSVILLSRVPCSNCVNEIINAGIKKVVVATSLSMKKLKDNSEIMQLISKNVAVRIVPVMPNNVVINDLKEKARDYLENQTKETHFSREDQYGFEQVVQDILGLTVLSEEGRHPRVCVINANSFDLKLGLDKYSQERMPSNIIPWYLASLIEAPLKVIIAGEYYNCVNIINDIRDLGFSLDNVFVLEGLKPYLEIRLVSASKFYDKWSKAPPKYAVKLITTGDLLEKVEYDSYRRELKKKLIEYLKSSFLKEVLPYDEFVTILLGQLKDEFSVYEILRDEEYFRHLVKIIYKNVIKSIRSDKHVSVDFHDFLKKDRAEILVAYRDVTSGVVPLVESVLTSSGVSIRDVVKVSIPIYVRGIESNISIQMLLLRSEAKEIVKKEREQLFKEIEKRVFHRIDYAIQMPLGVRVTTCGIICSSVISKVEAYMRESGLVENPSVIMKKYFFISQRNENRKGKKGDVQRAIYRLNFTNDCPKSLIDKSSLITVEILKSMVAEGMNVSVNEKIDKVTNKPYIEVILNVDSSTLTAYWLALCHRDFQVAENGGIRSFSRYEIVNKLEERAESLIDGMKSNSDRKDFYLYLYGDNTAKNPGLINVVKYPDKWIQISEEEYNEYYKSDKQVSKKIMVDINGNKWIKLQDLKCIKVESYKQVEAIGKKRSDKRCSLMDIQRVAHGNPYFARYIRNLKGKRFVFTARGSGSIFQSFSLMNMIEGKTYDSNMFFISKDTLGYDIPRMFYQFLFRLSEKYGDYDRDDEAEKGKSFARLAEDLCAIKTSSNEKSGIFDNIYMSEHNIKNLTTGKDIGFYRAREISVYFDKKTEKRIEVFIVRDSDNGVEIGKIHREGPEITVKSTGHVFSDSRIINIEGKILDGIAQYTDIKISGEKEIILVETLNTLYEQYLKAGILEGLSAGDRIVLVEELANGTYYFMSKYIIEKKTMEEGKPIYVDFFTGQARSFSQNDFPDHPMLSVETLMRDYNIRKEEAINIIENVSNTASHLPHPVMVPEGIKKPIVNAKIPLQLEEADIILGSYLKSLFLYNGVINYFEKYITGDKKIGHAFNAWSGMMVGSLLLLPSYFFVKTVYDMFFKYNTSESFITGLILLLGGIYFVFSAGKFMIIGNEAYKALRSFGLSMPRALFDRIAVRTARGNIFYHSAFRFWPKNSFLSYLPQFLLFDSREEIKKHESYVSHFIGILAMLPLAEIIIYLFKKYGDRLSIFQRNDGVLDVRRIIEGIYIFSEKLKQKLIEILLKKFTDITVYVNKSVVVAVTSPQLKSVFDLNSEEIMDGIPIPLKNHTNRVHDIALRLADEMGISENDKKILEYAIFFHDIGNAEKHRNKEIIEKNIAKIPFEDRVQSASEELKKWLDTTAYKYVSSERIERVREKVEKNGDYYHAWILYFEIMFDKEKLTKEEEYIAYSWYFQTRMSVENLKNTSCQYPREIEFLVKYHHDYTDKVIDACRNELAVSGERLNQIILLLDIFMVSDSFEMSNNYEMLVSLGSFERVRNFKEGIDGWLSRRFKELAHGKRGNTAILVLKKLLKRGDEKIFDILGSTRQSYKLLEGDLKFLKEIPFSLISNGEEIQILPLTKALAVQNYARIIEIGKEAGLNNTLSNFFYDRIVNMESDSPDIIELNGKWSHSYAAFDIDGKLVGIVMAYECESNGTIKSKFVYVESLAVDKNYRRRNIAAILLRIVAKNLLEKGFVYLKKNNMDIPIGLRTGIGNFKAQKLYEKLGFICMKNEVYSKIYIGYPATILKRTKSINLKRISQNINIIIGITGKNIEKLLDYINKKYKTVKVVSLNGSPEDNLKAIEKERQKNHAYGSFIVDMSGECFSAKNNIREYKKKIESLIEKIINMPHGEQLLETFSQYPEKVGLTNETIETLQALIKIAVKKFPEIKSYNMSRINIYEHKFNAVRRQGRVVISNSCVLMDKFNQTHERNGTKVASFRVDNLVELKWLIEEHRRALKKYSIKDIEEFPIKLHIRLSDRNANSMNIDSLLKKLGIDDVIDSKNISFEDNASLSKIYDDIVSRNNFYGIVSPENIAICDTREELISDNGSQELLKKNTRYVRLSKGSAVQAYSYVSSLLINGASDGILIENAIVKIVSKDGINYIILEPVKPIDADALREEIENYEHLLIAA
ncbi:membrane protein containing GCN5-related N-acetyltransferase domain protein [Candidatus Omnitrophus magneticus]|uniref:Membrane protein containing GCN5-related N-acetyltransferase domain protein n=1 Tax=Candidatus Omnitrophus magneticus TaxID=1609969 RepID=A0A0F0CQB3_9BACT|nr:membrane protein containing GCN5-related N-acetyltransferase domain protein [Candidatus Omnitrophus magneticus]